MGGDRGPAEIVAGALEARSDAIVPVIFGDAGIETHGLELRETTGVIGMEEKPSEAVRSKPDSSLVTAVRAVAEGTADAVVSAGNTGAMLAAGLIELRRIPGVLRPAIAVPLPAKRGPSVLIDAGANADARAEHLLQFATMGAVFAEEILGIENPGGAPALDRRGAREGEPADARGPRAARGERPELHRQRGGARHPHGRADVLVTDGFTGNVALKTVEGTILTLLAALREEITATATGKLGGLLIRPAGKRLRRRLDPDVHGGAYLLGLRGLAVIAHGNSSRTAIANAIRLAARGVEHDVVGALATRLPQRAEAV